MYLVGMEAKFGLIFGHCCGLQQPNVFLLVYRYFIEVLRLVSVHITGALNTLNLIATDSSTYMHFNFEQFMKLLIEFPGNNKKSLVPIETINTGISAQRYTLF